MIRSIDDEFFRAIPTAGMSSRLRAKWQEALQTSYLNLLPSITSALPECSDLVAGVDEVLRDLDVTKPFGSSIYASHFQLLRAMKTKSPPKVLSALTNFSKQACYQEGTRIEGIRTEWWEQDAVAEQEANVIEGSLPVTFTQISEDSVTQQKAHVLEALSLMKRVDPDFYEEVEAFTRTIKLHLGQTIVGVTSPMFFGTIYLSTPHAWDPSPVPYYIEHITHETSHLYLNCLLGFDRLVLNDPSERFSAPIRKDPRPMLGIYHATFVLSRMVRVLGRCMPHLGAEGEACYNDALIKLRSGFKVVSEHARLTSRGSRIMSEIQESVLA